MALRVYLFYSLLCDNETILLDGVNVRKLQDRDIQPKAFLEQGKDYVESIGYPTISDQGWRSGFEFAH